MSSILDIGGNIQMRNSLDKILDNSVKTKLLRTLCKYDTEWTGRQLAKELSVSPTTAGKFLKELVDEGIINMKGAGRSYLYNLNDKNYIVKNLIRPFFEKEKDVFNALIDFIKKAILKTDVKIESCVIFGSIAQKRETAKSDIDLLILLNNKKDAAKIESKLDDIAPQIAQNFQTAISPFILTVSEFRYKYKRKEPIVNEILKSYILVIGKTVERIIV